MKVSYARNFLFLFFSIHALILIAGVENSSYSFLKTLTLKKGFEADLFAVDPMVSNPIAFSFDYQGNLFVAESYRFGSSIPNTRQMPFLKDADRSSRNLTELYNVMRKFFGKNMSQYDSVSENVRLLKDVNGSGSASYSSVYATDFKEPLNGTAATILARNGKVWLGNIPNLWLLSGIDDKGKAKQKKKLISGFGVRFGFGGGHDLRGLVLGPDGKIYFSVGDRGTNIKNFQGKSFFYPDEGVVFRCDQDGSNLEVFARGFRNIAKLVFDNYGNLFTADNDHDINDQERWLYVVEGGDYGWRQGYQYLENAGPWNNERIWTVKEYPQSKYTSSYAQVYNSFLRDKSFTNLFEILRVRFHEFKRKVLREFFQKDSFKRPVYSVPAIANIGNGPSGVAFYPITGVGDEFENRFFVSHFALGLQSDIYSFKLKEKGAGFEPQLFDNEVFVYNAYATDIDFGPDSSFYFSNWGSSMEAGDGKGRIVKVFDKNKYKSDFYSKVKQTLSDGMLKKNEYELILFLSHPDSRVRLESQFELVRRGESSFSALKNVLLNNQLQKFEKIHALWAIEQLGAKVADKISEIYPVANDLDPHVRAQAIKTIGTFKKNESFDVLIKGLGDDSSRVKYFAALALGNLGAQKSVNHILKMIQDNNDKDYFLMHAGVVALLKLVDENFLLSLSNSSSRSVRMAIVQVLRRKESSLLTNFLSDLDEDIVLEAVRAIHDVPVETSFESLASMLDNKKINPHVLNRAINASFRIGDKKNAFRLMNLLKQKDFDVNLKETILDNFIEWNNPSRFDKIIGLYRPLSKRDFSFMAEIIKENLNELFLIPSRTARLQLLKLIGLYKIEGSDRLLVELCLNDKSQSDVKVESLKVLKNISSNRFSECLNKSLKDASLVVRLNALGLAGEEELSKNDQIVSIFKLGSIDERRLAFSLLGKMKGSKLEEVLEYVVSSYKENTLPKELYLEAFNAVELLASPHLKNKLINLKKQNNYSIGSELLWGGNSQQGRKVFFDNSTSCQGCHYIEGNVSDRANLGPNLSGIGKKKDRAYLLESVLYPNAKIAQGFQRVQISTKKNENLTGILINEDESLIRILRDDSGSSESISKNDINSFHKENSAMPEWFSKILKPDQIRDLVEYLATESLVKH